MLYGMKKFFQRSISRSKNITYNVTVVENGSERPMRDGEFPWLRLIGKSKNNYIKVSLPQNRDVKVFINFVGENNTILLGADLYGIYNISCYDYNNHVEIGAGTEASGPVDMALIGNTLRIGEQCMFASGVRIWGDGHAVLDVYNHEVINKPVTPIVIGNHCWIGERVTLNKNAQIPDDTVVGIASVVTRKFDESHCIIAGAPAKIVKKDVTWDHASPLTYKKSNQKREKK